MKKYNKKIIKKLLVIYFIVLVSIFVPVFIIGGEIVDKFIYNYILVIILFVIISFGVNYLIAIKLNKKIDLEEITNIIISEIFNDNKLEIEYSEDLKNMLKKLENEKESKTYSMEKYKEAEKIRTEFTANVTHELKTPLTSIIGYAELIEMGMGKEEDTKKFAQTIREDSRKLLLIIDDIITLSKYDDPTSVKLDFEYFDMGGFVRELISNIEAIARSKNVRITTEIENIYVYADKSKIKDLVNNLLSNAIKYNKENGTIKVRFFKEKNNVVLEVEDNGIGISDNDKNRIFERFYVVDKARGKKAGTGLGLAIVKHVALIHKGTIAIESKKGRGSKFTFEFPNKTDK